MRPRNSTLHVDADTLSLHVDELREWIQTPEQRPASVNWAAVVGELLLNCGAIERLLDALLEHYTELPRTSALYRKPWPVRRAFLEDKVRLKEAKIPRRAAVLQVTGKLDAAFDFRQRLMHGRPCLTRAHADVSTDDLDGSYVEFEQWARGGFELKRAEYETANSYLEQSRQILRDLEAIWAELPIPYR